MAKTHTAGELSRCLNAGGMGRQDYETETLIPVIGGCFSSDLSPALSGNPYGDHESREGLLVTHSLRGEGFDASEDGSGRGTPLVVYQCQGTNVGPIGSLRVGNGNVTSGVPFTLSVRGREEGGRFEFRQDGTANAILTPNGGRAGIGVGAIAYRTSGNSGVMEQGDRTAALNCGTDPNQQILLKHGVRRLTPVECERLQGFPDGYTDVIHRGKPAKDGPRYRAIGNSMAVPVLSWIGRRIEAVNALGPA